MLHKINANISHAMYFSAAPVGGEKELDRKLKAAFKNTVMYSSKGEAGEQYTRDMQIVEDFLRGGAQTGKVIRYFLKDFYADPERNGLDGWCVMLTFFAKTNILALSFHYSLKDTDTDTLIARRQSGTGKEYIFPDGTYSCKEIAKRVILGLGLEPSIDGSYLCEITKFGDYTDIDNIRNEHANLLYGLLSGDEGYEFVPGYLVEERLGNFWGSRSFTRLYACHQSCLFFNLLKSPDYDKYLKRQTQYGTDIYGGPNPYFFIGESPLTVNHGVLFSVEFVMMLKALVKEVLAFHTHYNEKKHAFSYTKRINETRELRRKIITVLEEVESTPISEIGEMSGMLLKSQNIAPVVDQVKYLLELLEGDLSLAYSEYNNALITVLTIGGLILSAIPYIPAVLEFFRNLFFNLLH